MPWNKPGTVPLYRYWKASVSDHFYTTNINEIAVENNGYQSEGSSAMSHHTTTNTVHKYEADAK